MRCSVSGVSTVAALGLFLAGFFLGGPARAADDPTADHYYRGNALYNRKMHTLAIEEYKLFLVRHRTMPRPKMRGMAWR